MDAATSKSDDDDDESFISPLFRTNPGSLRNCVLINKTRMGQSITMVGASAPGVQVKQLAV